MKKLLSLFVLVFCSLSMFATNNLWFKVDSKYYHEGCDSYKVIAGSEDQKDWEGRAHELPTGTKIEVYGACKDSKHHVVITVNGEEVTPDPNLDDDKSYTKYLELDEDMEVVIAFKEVYTLDWTFSKNYKPATNFEACDYTKMEADYNYEYQFLPLDPLGHVATAFEYMNGETLSAGSKKFDEGTVLYVKGLCKEGAAPKSEHHFAVRVDGDSYILPDEDYTDKGFKLVVGEDIKECVDISLNDTCDFTYTVKGDDENDAYEILTTNYTKDALVAGKTYKFDQGTHITMKGECGDGIHHVIYKVNDRTYAPAWPKEFDLNDSTLINDACYTELEYDTHHVVTVMRDSAHPGITDDDTCDSYVVTADGREIDNIALEEGVDFKDGTTITVTTTCAGDGNGYNHHVYLIMDGDTINKSKETTVTHTFQVEKDATVTLAYVDHYPLTVVSNWIDPLCDSLKVALDGIYGETIEFTPYSTSQKVVKYRDVDAGTKVTVTTKCSRQNDVHPVVLMDNGECLDNYTAGMLSQEKYIDELIESKDPEAAKAANLTVWFNAYAMNVTDTMNVDSCDHYAVKLNSYPDWFYAELQANFPFVCQEAGWYVLPNGTKASVVGYCDTATDNMYITLDGVPQITNNLDTDEQHKATYFDFDATHEFIELGVAFKKPLTLTVNVTNKDCDTWTVTDDNAPLVEGVNNVAEYSKIYVIGGCEKEVGTGEDHMKVYLNGVLQTLKYDASTGKKYFDYEIRKSDTITIDFKRYYPVTASATVVDYTTDQYAAQATDVDGNVTPLLVGPTAAQFELTTMELEEGSKILVAGVDTPMIARHMVVLVDGVYTPADQTNPMYTPGTYVYEYTLTDTTTIDIKFYDLYEYNYFVNRGKDDTCNHATVMAKRPWETVATEVAPSTTPALYEEGTEFDMNAYCDTEDTHHVVVYENGSNTTDATYKTAWDEDYHYVFNLDQDEEFEIDFNKLYDLAFSVDNEHSTMDPNCDMFEIGYVDVFGDTTFVAHPFAETLRLDEGTFVYAGAYCTQEDPDLKHHAYIRYNGYPLEYTGVWKDVCDVDTFTLVEDANVEFIFNEMAILRYHVDPAHCNVNCDQWSVNVNTKPYEEQQGWRYYRIDKGTQITVTGMCDGSQGVNHHWCVKVNDRVLTPDSPEYDETRDVYVFTTVADTTSIEFAFFEQYNVTVALENQNDCDAWSCEINSVQQPVGAYTVDEGTVVKFGGFCDFDMNHKMVVKANGEELANVAEVTGAYQFEYTITNADVDFVVSFEDNPLGGIEDVNANVNKNDGKYLNKKNDVIIVREGKEYTTAGTLVK